jgi:carboxylesterase type B
VMPVLLLLTLSAAQQHTPAVAWRASNSSQPEQRQPLYTLSFGALQPGGDLHVTNVSNLHAALHWCTSHTLCRGFTYQNISGLPPPPPPPYTTVCFFRTHINISACANSTTLAVFTRSRQDNNWIFHANKTCQPGAGATIPRGAYGPNGPWGTFGRWDVRSGEWSANATVDECKAACVADRHCRAIVVTQPGIPMPAPPPPPLSSTDTPVYGRRSRGETWPKTVFFKLGVVPAVAADVRWTRVIKASAVSTVDVTTPLGTLRGWRTTASSSVVHQFLGVRYAEPIGPAMRWRHATPKRSWKQGVVVDALRVGSACPSQNQPPNVAPERGSAWWPARPYNEDCLFLNLYTPSIKPPPDSKLLPVLFWIHGGSFIAGTGNSFNGTEIASRQKGPMVVVCINYRLGVFGYLGAQELRSRTSDGSTGNFGQADQRQAMRWVQQNIHAFGGDKDRVMIMGQSSGAGSVSTHLVSVPSFGLFRYATMASGPFGTWISQSLVARPPKVESDGAQATFDALVNETGCRRQVVAAVETRRQLLLSNTASRSDIDNNMDALIVECLQRTPADVLVTSNASRAASFGPVVDGVELTASPRELLTKGQIPPTLETVIFGSVSEDSGLALVHNASVVEFSAAMKNEYLFGVYLNSTNSSTKDPTPFAQLLQLYGNDTLDGPSPLVFPPGFPPAGLNPPPNTSANFNNTYSHWYWAAKHTLADGEMLCPARWAARRFRQRGVNVYQYQFRHPALSLTCKTQVCNAQGAPHSSDVNFWFVNRNGGVQTYEELQLAEKMSGYLTHTAMNGRPTQSPEEWPVWDQQRQPILVLDVETTGGIRVRDRMREEFCQWWDRVPDKYVPIS